MLDYDRKFKCFVCSIEKNDFLKQGLSFENHRAVEHNPWNYVYYLTHIKEKNSSDYNGIESYIFEKWEQQDISWFPIGKALELNEVEHEEDEDKTGFVSVWKKFIEKHGEEKITGAEKIV